MTPSHASSRVQLVLPEDRPERRTVRRAPAAAVGLVTAAVLGAGVLLLTGDGLSATDELTTVAVVERPAHAVPAALPAPTTAPQVPVLQFRDPFRPLVSDAGEQAPVAAPVMPAPAAVPDTRASAPFGGTASAPDGGTASAPDGGTTSVDEPARTVEVPRAAAPLPPPAGASTGAPSAGGASLTGRRLSLTSVQAAGDSFTAVLSLDGTALRAAVGATFGPGGELRLLSLQQGPSDGQWTAVVQKGTAEPFDVVTGTPKRLP